MGMGSFSMVLLTILMVLPGLSEVPRAKTTKETVKAEPKAGSCWRPLGPILGSAFTVSSVGFALGPCQ